MSAFKFEVHMT